MTAAARTDRRKRTARDAGFTLVEMAVVLTVLGMVAAISIVGTKRLIVSSRLSGATTTLMADLHYARTLATTERRNIQVTFTSSGYSVARVSPAQVVIDRRYPQGVTGSSTANSTFYAWGLAVASNVTLTGPYGNKVVHLASNGHVSR